MQPVGPKYTLDEIKTLIKDSENVKLDPVLASLEEILKNNKDAVKDVNDIAVKLIPVLHGECRAVRLSQPVEKFAETNEKIDVVRNHKDRLVALLPEDKRSEVKGQLNKDIDRIIKEAKEKLRGSR